MAGDMPWPEVPVRNANHANTAVLIVGAGISGMCTAIDLIKRNNCRNFIIVEKSGGVGGTWRDNAYPGCCCDVWSTLYSYSFAQNSDWTREYPGQEEILEYLLKTAQEYGLYKHVRFNTAVEDATWDDAEKKWRVKVSTAKGSKDAEFHPEYTISADFLVSAVGQLNQPKWPDLEGIDDAFQGKKMHSARWDWSYDLKDKKIAMIGNGCTSAQILPEIIKVAKHVTVFQRTPNWVIPRLDAPVTAFMRNVYKYVPPIRWRKRAKQMDFREGFYDAVIDGKSNLAEAIRDQCKTMMQTQLADRPDLWDALTPKYNPGCKRVIITDDYYPALMNPKVSLETRPIHSIGSSTVNVKGTDEKPEALEDFDLLVCATGFKTVQFMHPIQMTGKGGRQLQDVWKEGAQAYYGTTIEDMPNVGILYGPNTNLGHNSIILMIETQSRYINGLIAPVLDARRQGKAISLAPKHEKVVAYNEKVQEVLLNSSFNDPNCNSWYKNETGRITNNWSGTVVEYQKMLSEVDFDDYNAEGSGIEIVKKRPVVKLGRVVEETQVSDGMLTALGVLSVGAVAAGWLMRNTRYLSALRAK